MLWIVEQSYQSKELINSLKKRNSKYRLIKTFSYLEEKFDFPNEPFICHGTLAMAKCFNYKGFMFDEQKLRCSYYYPRYKNWLLVEDEYQIIKGKNIKKLKNQLYKTFGVDGVIFIKPDTNDKAFSGCLVESERFNKKANYIALMHPELDCVISRPWKTTEEWRLFVCYGKVVTGSGYKHNGFCKMFEGYPDEAVTIAERACDSWTPHPMLVVDICKSGDEYCILEIGSWNCAGYYKSDTDKIIEAAERCYVVN